MACLGSSSALKCGLEMKNDSFSVWDFMLADSSNSMFPAGTSAVMLYFLFRAEHGTFPGFKSRSSHAGRNVIHFTKSCIVRTPQFIRQPKWPPQIPAKRGNVLSERAAEELSLVLNSQEI